MDPDAPVKAEEILLRRVPAVKMSRTDSGAEVVAPEAFGPDRRDEDGLSLFRSIFHSDHDVGVKFRSAGKQPSWVAHIRADEFFKLGLAVLPKPVRDPVLPKLGHAVAPELNSAVIELPATKVTAAQLSRVVFKISGPFYLQHSPS